MQGKANYTKTPQSTGGRGPLQCMSVSYQSQPTYRVHKGIPTCPLHDEAKRLGKQTQEINCNPYSLMHGINKYRRAGQNRRKRRKEENKSSAPARKGPERKGVGYEAILHVLQNM